MYQYNKFAQNLNHENRRIQVDLDIRFVSAIDDRPVETIFVCTGLVRISICN